MPIEIEGRSLADARPPRALSPSPPAARGSPERIAASHAELRLPLPRGVTLGLPLRQQETNHETLRAHPDRHHRRSPHHLHGDTAHAARAREAARRPAAPEAQALL